MANTFKSKQVVTPEGRLLFPALFEPKAFENSTVEKYSCVLAFDADADLSLLINEVREAAKAAGLDKGARNPLCKGDDKVAEWGDAFAGKTYIRIATQFKPFVCDRNKQEIIDPSKVYSGCYARAVVHAYPYNKVGNKGVSFGLDSIQITRDGERLGTSGAASAALFDELPDAPKAAAADPFADL